MTKPLHIAIVLGSFRTGGAEKVMIRLANGFAGRNITCSLVVLDNAGALRSSVSPDVQVVNLGVRRAREGVNAFRQFLRENDPGVLLVSQTHIQIMTLLAVKWERWKGKVILNEHSLFSYNNKRPLNKLLARYFFSRADAITAVSKAVADDFSKNFPSLGSKISVIHNAAFDQEILAFKELSTGTDFSVPVILTAGRLVAGKNFRLLLEAFALVIRTRLCRLVFLGDGDQADELRKYAIELGISGHVTFAGNVDNPYAWMNRCSVFVMTSTYEGLPTVLIEALACGCNIVLAEGPGGGREILLDGKLGSIVPATASDLSSAILKKLNEPRDESQKILRAKEFNTEIAIFKYLSLINHLM